MTKAEYVAKQNLPMNADAQAVYFSRHAIAGPEERFAGSKLGEIVQQGYIISTRDGNRFEISTLDWDLVSKDEEFRRVAQIIKERVGRNDLQIKFS